MVPLKRRVARAAVVLLGVLGVNCRDGMGPPSLAGRLAFLPTFESSGAGIVDFDRMRVTLMRPPRTSVLDTVIAVPPTADSVDLLLGVPLSSSSEDLQLYLRLINTAGDTVFRNTPYPQTVTVTTGTPAIIPTPIEYVGVGFDAVAVVITSPDTTLFFGDSLQLGAVALSGTGLAIPGTPIAWRSLDPARVGVPDAAVGEVVAGSQRGAARIVGELLTGLADTVFVIAQPLPAALALVSGDTQTAVPAAILPIPLRARVLGSDGLGVRGVPVAFRALAPGASVTLDTVISDQLGYAEVIGALGPALGLQTFEASVAGAAPLTFTATAISATIASVTIDRTVDTIPRGAPIQYSAVARDALGNPVAVTIGWTSTVGTVATIDQTGLALGVGADSTNIIASAAGHADTAVLYVRALTQVVASPKDTVITAVGDSLDISATAYDNFGQIVTSGFTRTFSSATPAVVIVDPKTGRTHIVGPGDGAIVIRDSVDAWLQVQTVATVRVSQLVKRLTNTPATMSIGVGGGGKIVARAYDRNGYPIPGQTIGFASRDTRFVTVDSSGLVTGVALDATTYVVDSLSDSGTVYWDSTLVQVVGAPPALLRWGFDSLDIGIAGTSVPLTLSRPDIRVTTVFLAVLPAIDTLVARPALGCGGPVLHRVTINPQSSGTAVPVCGLKAGIVRMVATDSAGVYSPDTMLVRVLAMADTGIRVAVIVQMQDALTFTPATVSIRVGESVTWQNFSGMKHTTTSDQPFWDQTVDNGQFFMRTFLAPGSFPYHCNIHPGMRGTVVVN
ncbi:MAG TPA: plastocyanin/azurin family copper-binding protein [Gemmatimonadales bacterium]|nr:plastocyanin/azurin family copper-binding protein [Gemmatimonadales bacterium]